MIIPMTRSGLRAAVRPYREALINWFQTAAWPEPALPEVLVRAGFSHLPAKERGAWRTVVLGPGVVVKTMQNSFDDPPYSPKYRRRGLFAPTIRLAENIIVQPRGRVVAAYSKKSPVRREYLRAVDTIDERWGYCDSHQWNFARFPDGSVRCIDY